MAVQLTGGIMEHTVPSNYNENKHGSKVTLNFSADPGETHENVTLFARHIADLARTTAISMAAGTLSVGAPPAPLVVPEMPAPVVAPVAPAPLSTVVTIGAASELPAPPAAPPASLPPPPTPAVVTAVTAAGPVVEPAVVPWDKRVAEHLTHAMQRLQPVHGEAASVKLRELIMQFLPPGSTAPRAPLIPPEHQELFLQHLAALA